MRAACEAGRVVERVRPFPPGRVNERAEGRSGSSTFRSNQARASLAKSAKTPHPLVLRSSSFFRH